MRVLGSTTGGIGHFEPLAAVLRACVTEGHEVRVACPASFAPTVDAAGFLPAPFDEPADEDWSAVMAGLPGMPPDDANTVVVRDVFGRLDTTAALPELARHVASWRPDVVVRDPAEYASLLVAEDVGAPRARVAISLASVERRFTGAAAEALAPLRAERGLPPDDDGIDLLEGVVLAAAPASLDGDDAAPARVHRYSEPLVPTSSADLDVLPPGHEPLVYVTLGTVAAGLGAWPGTYRAIIDALAEVPVRVLVTTGRGVDPAEIGPLPPRTVVTPFVPQAVALDAASVAVVHGGFGTILGALRAGVPMAVTPLFADQPYTAARLQDVGAAVWVPMGLDPSVVPEGVQDHVRVAVERLLDEPAPRAAAVRLADEMAAHPPLEDAVRVIEGLTAGGR